MMHTGQFDYTVNDKRFIFNNTVHPTTPTPPKAFPDFFSLPQLRTNLFQNFNMVTDISEASLLGFGNTNKINSGEPIFEADNLI